jgi:Zn-dependent M28 family amino/carboxypeptidase
VLISAHYDHLGACDGAICNGADDNAAGVAIALGVACTFATEPAPRTVMVAFWDAEEPPTFMTDEMGSAFFVANPTIELERIDASIVLDLVGSDLWQGYEGHFVLGEETSPQLTAALDATQVPEQLPVQRGGLHLIEQTPFGHQPWSDYNAFRNAQVPVLFLSNGQNQRYHTPADEMDMINMPKVAREGRMLLSLTWKLAHAEQSAQFAAERTIYPQDATSMRRVLEAALADGGLVDSLGLSQRSRSSLQRDLQAVTEAEQQMESGNGATQDDVQALRNAAQRIMCLAGPTYDEGTCNLF